MPAVYMKLPVVEDEWGEEKLPRPWPSDASPKDHQRTSSTHDRLRRLAVVSICTPYCSFEALYMSNLHSARPLSTRCRSAGGGQKRCLPRILEQGKVIVSIVVRTYKWGRGFFFSFFFFFLIS